MKNPLSWVQAKENEWLRPASHEEILQIFHINMFISANSKKKPRKNELVPFPWKDKSAQKLGKSLPLKDAWKLFKRANPELTPLET